MCRLPVFVLSDKCSPIGCVAVMESSDSSYIVQECVELYFLVHFLHQFLCIETTTPPDGWRVASGIGDYRFSHTFIRFTNLRSRTSRTRKRLGPVVKSSERQKGPDMHQRWTVGPARMVATSAACGARCLTGVPFLDHHHYGPDLPQVMYRTDEKPTNIGFQASKDDDGLNKRN